MSSSSSLPPSSSLAFPTPSKEDTQTDDVSNSSSSRNALRHPRLPTCIPHPLQGRCSADDVVEILTPPPTLVKKRKRQTRRVTQSAQSETKPRTGGESLQDKAVLHAAMSALEKVQAMGVTRTWFRKESFELIEKVPQQEVRSRGTMVTPLLVSLAPVGVSVRRALTWLVLSMMIRWLGCGSSRSLGRSQRRWSPSCVTPRRTLNWVI